MREGEGELVKKLHGRSATVYVNDEEVGRRGGLIFVLIM